jgi:hypothetical protein
LGSIVAPAVKLRNRSLNMSISITVKRELTALVRDPFDPLPKRGFRLGLLLTSLEPAVT